MILRRERRDRFTIVDNTAIEDGRLSYKALGILAYLLSRPDGWAANYRQLSHVHDDGETAVRSGLDELRNLGYLEQRRTRHPETGKFVWECIIREIPVAVDNAVEPVGNSIPCGGFPVMDAPGVENHRNSKEGRSKTEQSPPLPPASGGRKTRKRDLPPEPLTVLERVDDFDAWWTAWPKKTAKLDAIRAWRVMLGWLPNIDRLIAATNAMEARTRRDHADDTNWQRWVPNPSTWLRRGDYLDDGNQLSTPVQVRRPCVLCGVEDPSPERCRGVDTGRISDIETECIWRTT